MPELMQNIFQSWRQVKYAYGKSKKHGHEFNEHVFMGLHCV